MKTICIAIMAILITIVLMAPGISAKKAFCSNGKFTIDGTTFPQYNRACYANGVITLTNLPGSEEISWKVSGDTGVGNVEAARSSADSTTTPKGGNMWCMNLWAPSSPSHTIYSNSLVSLQDLHSKICSKSATSEEAEFAPPQNEQTSMPLSKDEENIQNFWGIFKFELMKIMALPEMKKIERECLMHMHGHHDDQPLPLLQEELPIATSAGGTENASDGEISEEKIVITDQPADEQLNKIFVMEEDESPLEITETTQSPNKIAKRSSSVSFSDFRCICNEPFFDSLPSSGLIECSRCAIFQHARCVGAGESQGPFLCARCIVISPLQQKSLSIALEEPISDGLGGEIVIDKSSPSLSPELVRSSTSFKSHTQIRPSLPTLLPAIKSQGFISGGGSSLATPKQAEMMSHTLAPHFPRITPPLLSSASSSSSKRGRKPKILKQNLSLESGLVPVLLSKETLPPSFSEPTSVERVPSSISYIPADHLRISNDARSLIHHAWKVFYASALSKRQSNHRIPNGVPAVLATIPRLISNETEKNKPGSILALLMKEFSLNCSFWSFGMEERPRSLRLFTREFKAPNTGTKSIGVFLTEDDAAEGSRPLLPGSFITMLTGTLLTRSALAEEFGSSKDDKAASRILQYFLFFHPTLPLVVDARKAGNMARFIRRSCRPNVAMRGIFVTGGSHVSHYKEDPEKAQENINEADPDSLAIATFSIGIFSVDRIRPGIDELMLPLDSNGFCSAPCPGPHTGHSRSCLDPSCSMPVLTCGEAPNSSSLPPPPAITTSTSSLPSTKESPQASSKRNLSSSSASSPSSVSSSRHGRSKMGKKRTAILSPVSPLSPTSSATNTLSLSREERKLQMYIESIQRLEQREKRKGPR
ncbi:hypothetical protein DI09_40p80 [Mitosporidium daphniae]|uniref:Ig-like domain-containing protein n=1 Tax=Mitosporidium daphniae TaxID=1485682 RepID=A0A098VQ90_9MICR|nr:uncharacterized protein DI09_40p80 [Mitosporidium daphniae]KGG51222.1 hypothetical protein DI09_40p80 [Mitosporidium daphniae]|eukprot:XP_013237667.1 uncharacterized protein DI09_40p80 [Mitosporidium daphniae]